MNSQVSADIKTINYYNNNSTEYSKATFGLTLDIPWQKFISHLQPGACILDVGCGSGRDIKYFQDLGYHTEGLEPSKGMAKVARFNTNAVIHEIGIDQLNSISEYDGIWACASLLHIRRTALPNIYESIMRALKPSGVFYFSLKLGSGTARRLDGRLFESYSSSEIIKMFNLENSEFEFWESSDAARANTVSWLNFLVFKPRLANYSL